MSKNLLCFYKDLYITNIAATFLKGIKLNNEVNEKRKLQ